MSGGAAKRLGIRAYARHRKALGLRGTSHTAVQKAIADGRISIGDDGLIDVAQADRDWEANTPERNAPDPATRPATEAATPPRPRGGGTGGNRAPAGGDSSKPAELFSKARAAKEMALAQIRQLELEEKRGNLVSIDFLESEMASALQVVRGFLSNLPAGLAPRLLACETVTEMQELLQEEVDRVLRELSGTNADEGDDDAPHGNRRVA